MSARRGHIVVYNDPRAYVSTSGLMETLKKSFPVAQIDMMDTENFLDFIARESGAVAVIPGIIGEESFLPALFGSDGLKTLQNGARKNLIVTICASSYMVLRETQYKPAWGPARHFSNPSPVFNGVARGPMPAGARPPGQDRFDDTTVIDISYKSADGTWKNTAVPYCNGPSLIPDSADPTLEILARYGGGDDAPIAAAYEPIGQGGLLWLGVLPYMEYTPVTRQRGNERTADFMDSLKPHEAGRSDFWSAIAQRIDRYLDKTPSLQPARIPAP